MTEKRLLTREEAAKYLATTSGTLAVGLSNKTIPLPIVKLGRAVRYDLEDLDRYIEKHKQNKQTVSV